MKTFSGKSGLNLLLSLAGILSFAAPKVRADEQKDPPTRVARISVADGSVSLQPGGEGDWGSAARNRPVTIGDKLWVDKDSRAELQAGTVSVHLGSMTALSFLNLDQGVTQMRLAEGSMNFRVSEVRQGDNCEVDAPNLAFIVKQAGAFRIDVTENGDSTRVTVIRGEGEVSAGGKTFPIHAGERAEFIGTENIESSISKAPGPDGLDTWADQRDRRDANSVSGKYVSPDMDGASDLDENGTWQNEPETGNVWYPNNVPPDWAPYSDGNWNYVAPWGWTWVGYEPWGFAPYHYGRWNYYGGRWGWCPGPFYGPAIYGPAFVGFYGGGFGFGIGWFPLGFGEPFYPWYHGGYGYIRNINIHNTFIRNTTVLNAGAHNFNYAYAHNVHAVTTASRSAFASGQAINRGATHLTEASLRGAQVSNSAAVNPTHQSGLGATNMKSNVARPSAAVQNRTVMARTAPAQGASQSNVRTMSSSGLTPGRAGTANSSTRNAPATSGTTAQRSTNSNNTRYWSAQGNTTDHGNAPAGFGSSKQPANSAAPTARGTQAQGNRPPWARGDAQSSAAGAQSSRSSTPNYTNNRASNPAPSRSYSTPRTYSAPSRSYPAPSHASSAPSHPASSGGSRSSGGGSSHGGGGGSHGHR